MKIIVRAALIGTLLLLASTANARQFMCPNTYQYIHEGKTEAEVLAACGEPASKKTEKKMDQINYVVEQWLYPIDSRHDGLTRLPNMMINFRDDVVSSITIEGNEAKSSSLCRGKVGVGNTKEQVVEACGQPHLRNTSDASTLSPEKERTTWEYNFGEYSSTVTLTFEQGKLTTISTR